MNVAVCEDNASDAAEICDYLSAHFNNNGYIGDIRVFENGEALLAAFAPGAFDVIFLDIFMNGISGMETAKKLRVTDRNFALVFITNSRQHSMEAFALRACAYVPKPIEPESMEIAFMQCQDVFRQNARFIEVTVDRQNVKIPLINIFYIEVYDKDALFHTTIGVLKTRVSLETIEPKLGGMFLRCHRSYIVNMNHMAKIGKQDILLKNGDSVPMRQRGRLEIRAAYGGFLTDRLYEAAR